MDLLTRAIEHITRTAEVPSFSSYEERLHPYVRGVFERAGSFEEVPVPGNNLMFRSGKYRPGQGIALAAHLDKIDHYGEEVPDRLPVEITDTYIEGAMDDSAGVGTLLALAEAAGAGRIGGPGLLFLFSEMEESKGLKEHPERLRNGGEGYTHGMGARRIARTCLERASVPAEVITVDTTPLFKGRPGVALYSKHWEYTELNPTEALIEATGEVVDAFRALDPELHLDNNTNDFLHYGFEWNRGTAGPVPSVALEPAIHPYHQQGERVFRNDIARVLDLLVRYLPTRNPAL